MDVWDGISATEGWANNYEDTTIFHITSAADFKAFANAVNNTSNGKTFAGKTVVLETGINLNGKEWTPIGENTVANYPGRTFSGVFDGSNHTIKNFIVNASEYWASAALFGTANRATIKNVVIDNAIINSTHYAGGILGYDTEKTRIDNCVVKNSTISSEAENSTGEWDNGDKVGGIVGYMANADIIKCRVENTTISGYRDIGGIIGYAGTNSVISGCSINGVKIYVDNQHNYKNYSLISEHDANAFVGESYGTIEDCTGTATINFLNNM